MPPIIPSLSARAAPFNPGSQDPLLLYAGVQTRFLHLLPAQSAIRPASFHLNFGYVRQRVGAGTWHAPLVHRPANVRCVWDFRRTSGM